MSPVAISRSRSSICMLHAELLAGVRRGRVDKKQASLKAGGWPVDGHPVDSVYITNLAANMNRLEMAVQVRLRNQTGSLWYAAGRGGTTHQPEDGAGQ